MKINNEAFRRTRYLLLFMLFCFVLKTPFVDAKEVDEDDYIPITGPSFSEIKSFKNIPIADEIGIVLEAFTIPIPGMKDAYNPSMIKTNAGYTIAFRYDLPWDRIGFKKARIGLINLDDQFRPVGNPGFLDQDDQVEDPKLFLHGDECFVTYSHLTFWDKNYLCNIGMSNVDLESQTVKNSWELLYKNGPKEKNWTPFSYMNEEGEKELYFIYQYNPLKIIKAKNPITGEIELPIASVSSPLLDRWESKWGKIRGGTPAIRLDSGEYMTFFHSSFRENSRLWYVMGAITFDGQPPFSIKSISQWPLLFKDIYTTPIAKGKNRILRAIFPGGLVQTTLQDRDVFQVLCGENDTSIKVVTIDKETLISYMLRSKI